MLRAIAQQDVASPPGQDKLSIAVLPQPADGILGED